MNVLKCMKSGSKFFIIHSSFLIIRSYENNMFIF